MRWPVWSLATVQQTRPRLRINQLGYPPQGPKRCTFVCSSTSAVPFVVRDASGAPVFSGRSLPWTIRPEPTSGLVVHVLDFSELADEGVGLRVEAGGHQSHRFDIGADLYRPLRSDALRFFHLMRSGADIPEETLPGYGRPAGHLGMAPNRGDTDVPAWSGPDAGRVYPGWRDQGRYDVSGGWYDAGDYGKYVTSGALAVWQLLGALPLVADQSSAVAGDLVAECRWQLDWLLRMQVPSGALAGLVFHRVHGTAWPPVPSWPHADPTARVLHRPSTPATLHLAAVAAQAARLLGDRDPAYAQRLLAAARTAYEAAHRHPDLLPPDDHARFGGGPYPDGDVTDDFYWAAAELWLATGDDGYRDDLEHSPEHTRDCFDLAGFDYDTVTAPARIDLALAGGRLGDHRLIVDGVRTAADRLLAVQADQPWGQPYAPEHGWDWGSNGRLLNNLVVVAVAELLTGDHRYRDGVLGGMDHLLGRNALGQSYVTGYGTDDSRHQRTRQFGRDLDPTMPPPPPGALAGGANSRPHPDFPSDERLRGLPAQCCYLDEPTSEVTNDVCIRWNAPLVWVAAYLSRP